MILDIAGALVTGVLSGGATGLLGIALQQWGDIKRRAHDLLMLQQQHTQTLELRRLELEQQLQMATQHAASAERLADIAAESRALEMASADLQASYAHDRATYSAPDTQQRSRLARWLMALVDALRGIIRPGVTVYSMVLLSLLLAWVRELTLRQGAAITADLQERLVLEVVSTATYLVTTTTVWWFGVRPAARK